MVTKSPVILIFCLNIQLSKIQDTALLKITLQGLNYILLESPIKSMNVTGCAPLSPPTKLELDITKVIQSDDKLPPSPLWSCEGSCVRTVNSGEIGRTWDRYVVLRWGPGIPLATSTILITLILAGPMTQIHEECTTCSTIIVFSFFVFRFRKKLADRGWKSWHIKIGSVIL